MRVEAGPPGLRHAAAAAFIHQSRADFLLKRHL